MGRVLEPADAPDQSNDPEGESDPEDVAVAFHSVPGQVRLIGEEPEGEVDVGPEFFKEGGVGPEPVKRVQAFEIPGDIGQDFFVKWDRFDPVGVKLDQVLEASLPLGQREAQVRHRQQKEQPQSEKSSLLVLPVVPGIGDQQHQSGDHHDHLTGAVGIESQRAKQQGGIKRP